MWGNKKKLSNSIDKSIVVKRSWMFRQSNYTKSWKQRLVSLTNSGEIRYYRTTQKANPSGIIYVSEIKRMRISEEYKQQKYVLELFTNQTLWAFGIKDREEAHQWMFAIQLVQEKRISDFNDLLKVQDIIGKLQECEFPVNVNVNKGDVKKDLLDSLPAQPPLEIIQQATNTIVQPTTKEIIPNNDLDDIFGLNSNDNNTVSGVGNNHSKDIINSELLDINEINFQNQNSNQTVQNNIITPEIITPIEKEKQIENIEITIKPETKPEILCEPEITNKNEDINTDNDDNTNNNETINEPTILNQKQEEKLPSIKRIQSHIRSSSEIKSTTTDDINENDQIQSHNRCPSDSSITSTPNIFEPHIIDTNWKSFRIRNMQIKTLQAWTNYKLYNVGEHIDDIAKGFSTGEVLCKLVETLTGEEISYNEDPSHVAFMHQNVNFAMTEFRKKYPNFPAVATHEIISGKLSAILEMIWNIINTTEISNVFSNELKGQEALLSWVQQHVQKYNIIVTNFEKCFMDGQVFCALLHSCDPNCIDYDSYSSRKKDMLQKVIDIAHAKFGIPSFLSADELMGEVDPISIIVYLYQWYNRIA